jgi:AcrR family transcriptional regulator
MSTDLVQANTILATVPVEETPELSPAQTAAVDALLSGKTATDAAAAAGVSRRTVYNWFRKDFRFQAALNRSRRDLQQAIGCRVEQIAADAAECVARAVREGNVKAAMEILKGLNMLAPQTVGSDDELLLQIEQEERLEKRDTKIALAGLRNRMLLAGER